MLFSTVFALAAVASVSAHGFVSNVAINGKNFAGPLPFSKNNAASPIRKITTTFPITSATDPDMNCGKGAVAASEVAPANPGDKVTISWESGKNKNWGHSLGPIMTYLAQVPSGQTADKFNTKDAKFFKIDQTGQTGGAGTDWVQASIKGGKTFTLTLPQNLPAGDYIMRHELIALHFATKKDGAQFYPACIQLRVDGGAKTTQAISAQTVSFPGGYTPNDKSLLVPDLFKNNFVYAFPGPSLTKSITTRSVGNPGNATIVDSSPASESEQARVKRADAGHVAGMSHGRVRSRVMQRLV